jgi:NADH-quinone oxidoreductase subunit J
MLWSVLVAGAGVLLSTHILYHFNYVASTEPAIEHTVKNIGTQLIEYTKYGYVLPFEIVSILLLAALVGSIIIAIKTKKN